MGRGRRSKSILSIFVLVIVVIFYSSSCHKGDIVRPGDEGPELSAHPDSFEVTAEAGSVDLNIENTGDPTLEWEITTEAAWLSLSTESGSEDGTVEISYQANPNSEIRNTEIKITSNGGEATIPFLQQAGPESPPDAPPCNSCGDVHIRTPDGLAYDFQGAGEYLLMASDDGNVVVQARQEPWSGSDRVSVNTAVTANVAGDQIAIYTDRSPSLYVNGAATTMIEERMALSNGGVIFEVNGGFIIRWPSGFLMSARVHGSYLDIGLSRPGDLQIDFAGLLGNMNGMADDDFVTRPGQLLSTSVEFNTLYKVFGDSWRIEQAESLFDYETGNSTDTYTLPDFPSGLFSADDLDQADYDAARQVCENAGITDPILLEDCILDVAITGDNSFAESARDSEQPTLALEVTPSLPVEGLIAYYPFNSNASDESGKGNDGTVNGATLTTDRFGNGNSAYQFDGVDDFINIGNQVKPPFPVTVSIWINSDELANLGIFRNDQVDDGSYRYGIDLNIRPDGIVSVAYYEGFSAPGNRKSWLSDDSKVVLGTWHHFLVVFTDHLDMKIFWDGEEIPGTSSGSGSGLSYSNSDGAIGHRRTNAVSPPDRYFNGILDDIRIYSRALTQQEIDLLYHEGDWDRE